MGPRNCEDNLVENIGEIFSTVRQIQYQPCCCVKKGDCAACEHIVRVLNSSPLSVPVPNSISLPHCGLLDKPVNLSLLLLSSVYCTPHVHHCLYTLALQLL